MSFHKCAGRKYAGLAAAVSVLLLLAACEGYDYRPLSIATAQDCTVDPGSRNDFDYWALGQSGTKVNWSGCNKAQGQLADANLSCADLSKTDLRGADLSGADLGCAYAKAVNLSGANLTGANVRSTWLQNANLTKANLTGVNWQGMTLPEGADFSGATWTDGKTVCAEGSIGECKK